MKRYIRAGVDFRDSLIEEIDEMFYQLMQRDLLTPQSADELCIKYGAYLDADEDSEEGIYEGMTNSQLDGLKEDLEERLGRWTNTDFVEF